MERETEGGRWRRSKRGEGGGESGNVAGEGSRPGGERVREVQRGRIREVEREAVAAGEL